MSGRLRKLLNKVLKRTFQPFPSFSFGAQYAKKTKLSDQLYQYFDQLKPLILTYQKVVKAQSLLSEEQASYDAFLKHAKKEAQPGLAALEQAFVQIAMMDEHKLRSIINTIESLTPNHLSQAAEKRSICRSLDEMLNDAKPPHTKKLHK